MITKNLRSFAHCELINDHTVECYKIVQWTVKLVWGPTCQYLNALSPCFATLTKNSKSTFLSISHLGRLEVIQENWCFWIGLGPCRGEDVFISCRRFKLSSRCETRTRKTSISASHCSCAGQTARCEEPLMPIRRARADKGVFLTGGFCPSNATREFLSSST